MKRDIGDFQNEIVVQILLAEVCFDICNEIQKIPGRSGDFLPFYHNLCYLKGIISLHSLLISKLSDELSLNNFIKSYEVQKHAEDILLFKKFKNDIEAIADSFRDELPFSIRNKTCAHLDDGFSHLDFANGYTLPDSVQEYIRIIKELKSVFFTFTNYAQSSYNKKLLEQSRLIVQHVLDNE